jgi:preprotein translocase subunit SecE
MSKIVNYIKKSYDELMHKVSWPTMSELTNSTVVVFVASLIIALIIFAMDMLMGVHPTLEWKGLLGFLYELIG